MRYVIFFLFVFKSNVDQAQQLIQVERCWSDSKMLLPEAFVGLCREGSKWVRQDQHEDFNDKMLSCFIFTLSPARKYFLLLDWGDSDQLKKIWLSQVFYQTLFKKERSIFPFDQCIQESLEEFSFFKKEESLLACFRRRLESCMADQVK